MLVTELQQMPLAMLLSFTALFGLVIGSFLNVVIHRLPQMLFRQWRNECQEFLQQTGASAAQTFNLASPGSHCPHCQHPIRWYHNLPVLSYIWLRGRCADCGAGIHWRYPLVELLTALVSMVVVSHFGVSIQAALALLFSWTLIALAAIDLEHQILPDSLTQGLIWLGLIASLWPVYVGYEDALLGAVFGYGSLWLVYQLFRLLTGKEGMGFGDFKLFAAAGAWLGWQMLPMVIMLASLLGATVGLILIRRGRLARGKPIPFGPYLALVSWVCLLWGEPILNAYLKWAGL